MRWTTFKHYALRIGVLAELLYILGMPIGWPQPKMLAPLPSTILMHDNLVAWEAAPYDSKKRSPEQRAQMLARLGIKHYAYLSSSSPWDAKDDINLSQLDVDAEIEAMQKYHIDILAWYFWINSDHADEVPVVRRTLESFRRHQIHPQIWVANSLEDMRRQWKEVAPKGLPFSVNLQEFRRLTDEEQKKAQAAALAITENDYRPKTPEAQMRRVAREAARIKSLVDLAAPYGCRVYLYNHRGWFGIEDNELAIIHQLDQMGVHDMRLVYNFAHSRDRWHDDAKEFPELWAKIKPYVSVVNLVGLEAADHEGIPVYPSRGNLELGMMRTIQDSGWVGPVGALVLWKQDDTEVVLRNVIQGIDRLAADLREPGSSGPRQGLSPVSAQ